MLVVADVLCALAGASILLLTLTGRPMRGEAFVGAHLVTGPFAIGFVLGAVLVQILAPLPSTAANVLLGLTWPGLLVSMTFLPLAACSPRQAWAVKSVAPLLVGAPFLLGHGGVWHPALPWVGGGVLAAAGLLGTEVVVGHRLRQFGKRLLRFRAKREPSAWECSQAEWQRGEWQKVLPDAEVAVLLGHVRSLAPDVQQACHARLLAHPRLEAGLAAELLGENRSAALYYLTHHYPRPLATFAPTMNELLATLRSTWPQRLRDDPHPRPWTGDLFLAMDAAIAVLVAGGDTRAALQAWQTELAAMPKFQAAAKDLARWIRKLG